MALACVALAACGAQQPPDRVERLDLDDYRGRWVVINYWAQWCKPCREEIPELNDFAQRYPEVAVLGVNYDGARDAELQAQIDSFGIRFPTLLEDPAAGLGVARPQVLPTTVFIGPDGALAATRAGPQTLESLAEATGQAPPPKEGSESRL
ncbi:TlpA family protein disulfide reductase [Mangrovimicrobium sediminis]|uniref:TlpA family protein disulfide reductase n=1 Tax=Mangrovimicrobium sediminis TaxID=2562682 RepID=A0A4Z0LXP7_9GAMM|nr:TlpA disulfide reductase family protein [Haliea sp. SAOS-164]TGD72059.1 TlpA family protein disulfide reductase [Haliea sp. SAOS-164]